MRSPGVSGEPGRPDASGAAAAGAGTATAPAGTDLGATALAGFWLPAELRRRLIGAKTHWQEARFARGRECGSECQSDATGAVAARWPLLTRAEWEELLAGLRAAREKAPRGMDYWERLQAAMAAVTRRLEDPADLYHQVILQAVPGYTGYSPGMIAATLAAPDLWDLKGMAAALRYQPDKVCSRRWQEMPGLPGRVHFFPSQTLDRVAGWLPVAWEMPLYRADVRPQTVVGYAAGNVPGGALMMIILALATTLRGEPPLPRPTPPPAVLVRNSRREPLLTPLVLSALEEADPELVSMVAALVWDHDDAAVQQQVLGEADLVLAAAGDDVIDRLSGQLKRLPGDHRFHPHGHKVSFAVISRDVLALDYVPDYPGWSPPGGTEAIDIVALLAGLDSAFWDQNGCLSPRIHFVERGDSADDLPADYARRLTARLRQIAQVIPRGAWPVRRLHDPFDRYKAMEGWDRWGIGLQVISDYDDPFLVVFDDRDSDEARLDSRSFCELVNECQTRVVVVRPVDDIMEVAWRYLDLLAPHSLQSLSVAVGLPGQGLTESLLDFAGACGARGVTAIRTVGRAAFPQPAYSWDGLLPIDLVGTRPPGHFTTIEFDEPFEEMMQTYRAHLARLAQLPGVG